MDLITISKLAKELDISHKILKRYTEIKNIIRIKKHITQTGQVCSLYSKNQIINSFAERKDLNDWMLSQILIAEPIMSVGHMVLFLNDFAQYVIPYVPNIQSYKIKKKLNKRCLSL